MASSPDRNTGAVRRRAGVRVCEAAPGSRSAVVHEPAAHKRTMKMRMCEEPAERVRNRFLTVAAREHDPWFERGTEPRALARGLSDTFFSHSKFVFTDFCS